MKLLIASVFICAFSKAIANNTQLLFQSFQIVPDVLHDAPDSLLSATFNDVKVEFSKKLTPTQVKDAPTLDWDSQETHFYTICMTDSDAPSRQNPTDREFLNWLVVNVPGSDLSRGKTLATYIGPEPRKGTGLHRYTLVVFRQPNLSFVTESPLRYRTREARLKFSIQKFADKYGFGTAIAGNTFQAQYEG